MIYPFPEVLTKAVEVDVIHSNSVYQQEKTTRLTLSCASQKV